MTSNAIREPLRLVTPDGESGEPHIVGNLLYMFGIINKINIAEMHKRIHHRLSNSRSISSWDVTLLKEGLNLRWVTDLDEAKALEPNGRAYLNEYRRKHGVAAPLTPEEYAALCDETTARNELTRNARGKETTTIEPLTKWRLVSMVKKTPVVLQVEEGQPIILYGLEHGLFKVYCPNSRQCIGLMEPDFVLSWRHPLSSFVAVSR